MSLTRFQIKQDDSSEAKLMGDSLRSDEKGRDRRLTTRVDGLKINPGTRVSAERAVGDISHAKRNISPRNRYFVSQ